MTHLFTTTQYAILVIWKDGTEEYVKRGDDTAVFSSRGEADANKEFIEQGIEGHQSVSVVRYSGRRG